METPSFKWCRELWSCLGSYSHRILWGLEKFWGGDPGPTYLTERLKDAWVSICE